ncbi:hypothetical protein [Rahnella laticis]|uniref:hypothetical protein n=1 Tax=Rahnella laticis TaxID=2787622 RepID=UPI0018A27025|nr:hypothetical protein [Rahnella laticis]MBF7993408.1 hypothetical protein [Rahnella laticis]
MENFDFSITPDVGSKNRNQLGNKKVLGFEDGYWIKITNVSNDRVTVKNESDSALTATIRMTNGDGSKDIKQSYRFDAKHSRIVRNLLWNEQSTFQIYDEKKCPREAPLTAREYLYITRPEQNSGYAWMMENYLSRYIYLSFDTIRKDTKEVISVFNYVIRPQGKIPIANPEDEIIIHWYGAVIEPD